MVEGHNTQATLPLPCVRETHLVFRRRQKGACYMWVITVCPHCLFTVFVALQVRLPVGGGCGTQHHDAYLAALLSSAHRRAHEDLTGRRHHQVHHQGTSLGSGDAD